MHKEFILEKTQNIKPMSKELSIGITLPTKDNIYNAAMNIVEQCQNGEINPLELAVKLTALEKICETIRENITENVLAELDKEQGKSTSLGAKVQRKEVGTKYDYSDTPIISQLQSEEKKLADRRKAIEKTAQLLPDGMTTQMIDESTGEAFLISKAAKTSKTSFSVTLSNE